MGTNTSKSPRPAMRGISNRERLAIQKQVQALLPQGMNFDDFFPPHGVSYGTGNREGVDAPGAGRGMVYAAAMIMALDAAGFSSFSGLMVQAGVDWEVYMLRLDSEMATAEDLVVIQTGAFYLSVPCLREVYTALTCDLEVKIFPYGLFSTNSLPNSTT